MIKGLNRTPPIQAKQKKETGFSQPPDAIRQEKKKIKKNLKNFDFFF